MCIRDSDHTGRLVITWQSKDISSDGSLDIFTRAFKSSLKKPGRINQLTSNKYDEGDSHVLHLRGNRWVTAWTEADEDGINRSVVGQLLDKHGTQVGNPFKISQYMEGNQQRTSLAALDGGSFIAAWDGAGSDDAQGIYARLFGMDGTPKGDQLRLNNNNGNVQNSSSIGIDQNGDLFAAWSSFNQATKYSQYDIYGQKLSNITKRLAKSTRKRNQTVSTKNSSQLYQKSSRQLIASTENSPAFKSGVNELGGASSGSDSNTESVRFAVIGDWGYTTILDMLGGPQSPMDYVAEMIRGWNPDFIVGLGDTNYLIGLSEQFDQNVGINFSQYIEPYIPQTSLGEGLQTSPVNWNRFFGVPGNHDYHDPSTSNYADIIAGREDYDSWFMPSLTTSANVVPLATNYSMLDPWRQNESYSNPYYDYRFSPIDSQGNILFDLANFYMIDGYQEAKGNLGTNSIQSSTILNDARSRPNDATWQIAASHFQNYSSSEGPTTAMDWNFQDNGFDLILGAHVHNYERRVDSGLTYIVNGIGGFDFPGDEFSPLPDGASISPQTKRFINGQFGAMLIELSKTRLSAQVYGLDPDELANSPQLIDSFTIYKNPGTGITSDGFEISDGGFDGEGFSYSYEAMNTPNSGGNLSGSNLLVGNLSINLLGPNQSNYIWTEGQTLTSNGEGQVLTLIGAAVNGSQLDQSIKLTFTDGSQSIWSQSFSDWCNPDYYSNEITVSTHSYRNNPFGSKDFIANHLYSYGYTLPSGNSLASITLPNNNQVRLLAVALSEQAEAIELPMNTIGISVQGNPTDSSRGFDGDGNFYSLEGISGNGGDGLNDSSPNITWAGATFDLGSIANSPGTNENTLLADGRTITAPSGEYDRLLLIGAATNGNQYDQKFEMLFNDGTTDTWIQSFTDWRNNDGGTNNPPPPSDALISGGEYLVSKTNLLDAGGNLQPGKNAYLFGYDYIIPEGKTLAGIILPDNRNVGILGLSLAPDSESITIWPDSSL